MYAWFIRNPVTRLEDVEGVLTLDEAVDLTVTVVAPSSRPTSPIATRCEEIRLSFHPI